MEHFFYVNASFAAGATSATIERREGGVFLREEFCMASRLGL
jgi:hypothetical protein